MFIVGGWAGRSSDLMAALAEKTVNSDLMARGNADLVAGLEGIQIY